MFATLGLVCNIICPDILHTGIDLYTCNIYVKVQYIIRIQTLFTCICRCKYVHAVTPKHLLSVLQDGRQKDFCGFVASNLPCSAHVSPSFLGEDVEERIKGKSGRWETVGRSGWLVRGEELISGICKG